MIHTNDLVRTTINNVKAITIDEIVEYKVYPFEKTAGYQRRITVHTQQDETFDLWPYADEDKNLELKKPGFDASWLTPEVYKGSMHAEEKDA